MSVKIDQALTQAFIDGAFGLPIAHENIPYVPTDAAYAELSFSPNDITPLTVSDTDETDGVMQVTLRYPLNQGAMPAKQKAGEIFETFRIGSIFKHLGQTVRIVRARRSSGVAEDGWYAITITLSYRAFLRRTAA